MESNQDIILKYTMKGMLSNIFTCFKTQNTYFL
jgi:hypothetical protein